MNVLITGADGQLGYELLQTRPQSVFILQTDRDQLDILDPEAIRCMMDEHHIDTIINCAAYTAVDQAEAEPGMARAINATGVRNLARSARDCNARILHVSTDFVFSGENHLPYTPEDTPSPISVYGQTKLEGEEALLSSGASFDLIRTSWIYSVSGNNFVKTMLRLMNEKPELSIVDNQVGTPTWAKGLASVIWQFLQQEPSNRIFHWSDAGVASWYDFAVAIQQEGFNRGLLKQKIPIKPIPDRDYPTPARRPHYSVLDKTETWKRLGMKHPVHWRTQLCAMLDEFKNVSGV